jgi:hypothetical protein
MAIKIGGTTVIDDSRNLTNLGSAITAAQGGTGLTSPGTAGNVLTSNGTTWTSAAAPASAGSITATATGSITSGQPVVVNADGTVSQVAPSSVSFSTGSPAYTNTTSSVGSCAVYHPIENKVVLFIVNNSTTQLQAYVGTVTGTSISFGAATTLDTGTCYVVAAVYVAATNRIYVQFGSNYGGGETRINVLSLSGTTLTSQGVQQLGFYYNNGGGTNAIAYDSANNRLLGMVYNSSQNDYEWWAGTPGTSGVSSVNKPGAVTGLGVGGEGSANLIYDPASQRILFTWQEGANWGASSVFNMTGGGNPTKGSNVYFNSGTTSTPSLSYDSANQRFVVMYSDSSVAGSQSVGQIGTISGGAISWGSKQVVFTGSSGGQKYQSTYNTATGAVSFIYDISNVLFHRTATISGTSLTFSSANQVAPSITNSRGNMVQIGTAATVFSTMYGNGFGSLSNYSIIIQPAYTTYNLTSENFIGFANGTFSNGQTATIQTVGALNSGQTSLTPGETYFVQRTGGIGLSASTPSVLAGTSVSSTSILVKG